MNRNYRANCRRVIGTFLVFTLYGVSSFWRGAADQDFVPASEDYPLLGRWGGTLRVAKMDFRLIIDIQRNSEGRIVGTAEAPDMGRRDQPVSVVLFNDPLVLIETQGIMPGTFKGKLSEDQSAIHGQWDFPSGMPMPGNDVTFKREGPVEEASPLDYSFDETSTSDVRGFWKGVVEPIPEMEVEFIMKIGMSDKGELGGSVDIPAQGATGLPVKSVSVQDTNVSVKLNLAQMGFSGTFGEKGTQMEGEWGGPGGKIPIRFVRFDPNADEHEEVELSFDSPSDKPDLRGHWEGVLEVQGARLRLVLHIGATPGGEFHGTLDSPDQGATGIPIHSVQFDPPEAFMDWKALAAKFNGKLSEDGASLEGKFIQLGNEMDMSFKRISGQ